MLAQRNAPTLLGVLAWLAPVLAIAVSAAVFIWFRPAGTGWWPLARVALAGAIGSFAVTHQLASGIGAGSAGSALPLAALAYWTMHLTLIAIVTAIGAVILYRSNQGAAFGAFALQFSAVLVALGALLFVAVGQTRNAANSMGGLVKAQALSRAYGVSISAKWPNQWSGDRTDWRLFTMIFQPPNGLRIEVPTNYSEAAVLDEGRRFKVRDPHSVVRRWNGDLGRMFLDSIGAKRPWRASWDSEKASLVWSAEWDMAGLTTNRFLDDTREMTRLAMGPLGEEAAAPSWFVIGEAVERALPADSELTFGLRWLETALLQSAKYYDGSKPIQKQRSSAEQLNRGWQQIARELRDMAANLATAPNKAAILREAKQLLERGGGKADEASNCRFLLSGSRRHGLLAVRYCERFL